MAHEMRKKIVTLCAAIVGFAVGINSQEISQEIKSAPATLQVCNAQVNLWVAQTDVSRPYGPEIRKTMSDLTSREILNRKGVINDCLMADLKEIKPLPEGRRVAKLQELGIRFDDAQTLNHLYEMELSLRYFNFIVRNNLLQKFDQEDKAGER